MDMKLQQYIPPPLPGRLNHPGELGPEPPDGEGGRGGPYGRRPRGYSACKVTTLDTDTLYP